MGTRVGLRASRVGRACVALALAWGVVLSGLPAPRPLAAAPLAHREVLPNGIVLLVAERPDVPIVAVRVFMRAGAVFDPADRAGLANLTGALLTRGTAKRTGVRARLGHRVRGRQPGGRAPAATASPSRSRC